MVAKPVEGILTNYLIHLAVSYKLSIFALDINHMAR